jgi:D-aminopeptidase
MARLLCVFLTAFLGLSAVSLADTSQSKPRARDLGIPFEGDPGQFNAFTDVKGVEVGYVTLISGAGKTAVRTGVTAILPRGKQSAVPVFANWFSLNGNGEMTGTIFLGDFGILAGPLMLTNTDSVGVVRDAVIAWQRKQPRYKDELSELPIVAETWDGRLNDIYGFHVNQGHVFEALDNTKSNAIAEGNVGGGTGMVCHGYKGGTGTSSRKVQAGFTLGVLVQANHGSARRLTIAGVPIGTELPPPKKVAATDADRVGRSGSIIVVVATDAPLLPHQLKSVAKRVSLGVGRVGGLGEMSSGDIFIAFSTANPDGFLAQTATAQFAAIVDDKVMNQLFEATVQATEEAIVNALIAAESMTGVNGNRVDALPHEPLREALRKYGRLVEPTQQ